MNCFIVVIRCSIDDLIVSVHPNEDEARAAIDAISLDLNSHLESCSRVYQLDPSEPMFISMVTVARGKVTDYDNIIDIRDGKPVLSAQPESVG